jgi:hypothetical protein
MHYLEKAYQITGDVPGINYLLASFYLRTQSPEKALTHMNLALDTGKDLYSEFADLFPTGLLTTGIIRLLELNDLI